MWTWRDTVVLYLGFAYHLAIIGMVFAAGYIIVDALLRRVC
jgi:hypothetical protein